MKFTSDTKQGKAKAWLTANGIIIPTPNSITDYRFTYVSEKYTDRFLTFDALVSAYGPITKTLYEGDSVTITF